MCIRIFPILPSRRRERSLLLGCKSTPPSSLSAHAMRSMVAAVELWSFLLWIDSIFSPMTWSGQSCMHHWSGLRRKAPCIEGQLSSESCIQENHPIFPNFCYAWPEPSLVRRFICCICLTSRWSKRRSNNSQDSRSWRRFMSRVETLQMISFGQKV